MRINQTTKAERQHIAKRSEEILDQDPTITLENLALRFGISYNNLHNIRKEFGCRSLNDIPGRRG